jgi:hypothetical protein
VDPHIVPIQHIHHVGYLSEKIFGAKSQAAMSSSAISKISRWGAVVLLYNVKCSISSSTRGKYSILFLALKCQNGVHCWGKPKHLAPRLSDCESANKTQYFVHAAEKNMQCSFALVSGSNGFQPLCKLWNQHIHIDNSLTYSLILLFSVSLSLTDLLALLVWSGGTKMCDAFVRQLF